MSKKYDHAFDIVNSNVVFNVVNDGQDRDGSYVTRLTPIQSDCVPLTAPPLSYHTHGPGGQELVLGQQREVGDIDQHVYHHHHQHGQTDGQREVPAGNATDQVFYLNRLGH